MSQPPIGYNPQYNFMPYYSATPQQLLAPAKWAGWIMIALGGLLMLAGTCVGAMLYAAPDDLFNEAIREISLKQKEIQFTPRLIRIVYGSFSGAIGVYGLVCIAAGAFVIRGGLIWIILGLAVTAIPLLLLIGMFLLSFTAGVEGALGALCIGFLPAALQILAIIFLIKAANNTSKINRIHQTLAMMHQHQMQQYYTQQQQPPQQ